jgi:hypothetical protein
MIVAPERRSLISRTGGSGSGLCVLPSVLLICGAKSLLPF